MTKEPTIAAQLKAARNEGIVAERQRIINRLKMRAANTRSLKGQEALLDMIAELVNT
jgi:hypothetical protein